MERNELLHALASLIESGNISLTLSTERGFSDMNDDQYTCTTCWSMGGHGTFTLERFTDYLLGRSEL